MTMRQLCILLRGLLMTQVIKMLVVVVSLFAICWLPLHAFILLIDFRPDITEYETISQKHFFVVVYSAVHWLAMSNSCVNPIIYGFLHDSFRVFRSYLQSILVQFFQHSVGQKRSCCCCCCCCCCLVIIIIITITITNTTTTSI